MQAPSRIRSACVSVRAGFAVSQKLRQQLCLRYEQQLRGLVRHVEAVGGARDRQRSSERSPGVQHWGRHRAAPWVSHIAGYAHALALREFLNGPNLVQEQQRLTGRCDIQGQCRALAHCDPYGLLRMTPVQTDALIVVSDVERRGFERASTKRSRTGCTTASNLNP